MTTTAAAARVAMTDSLSRFVFEHAAVRGAVVSLDDTCRDILGCHPYPPALARTLALLQASAALLAASLKFKGSLIVQLQGTGPVRLLVVECDAALNLRACAKWVGEMSDVPVDTPLAQLAGDPSKSTLAIMLDPKDGSPVYQGIVALEAASVAQLIEHYLVTSEQIDSRLVLAAEGTRARGLLLQRLPGAGPDDDVTWARAAECVGALAPSALLAADAAATLVAAQFPGDDVRLFAPKRARFECSCSEERIANMLKLIGRIEVESILSEQGMVGITCEFCNRSYTLDAEDARALFADEAAPREAPNRAPH